jgi:hypothetical protein
VTLRHAGLDEQRGGGQSAANGSAWTVLVPASALFLDRLAIMVGNRLGALNSFGVSPLALVDLEQARAAVGAELPV